MKMKNRVSLFVFFIGFLFLANANDLGIKDLTYKAKKSETLLSENKIIFEDIVLNNAGIILKAKKLILNYKTKDIIAQGDVQLRDKNFTSHSTRITGNLQSNNYTITNPRMKYGHWKFNSQNMGVHNKQFFTHKVVLTTCNKQEHSHHYNIVADKVIYTSARGFRAYDSIVYLHGFPILYLPYFPGELNLSDGPFVIRPAYSSSWGATLLTTLPYHRSENLNASLLLDWRYRRGLALGHKTSYKTAKSSTEFVVYGIDDKDSPLEGGFIGRSKVKNQRYRLSFKHSSQIAKQTYLKSFVEYNSDSLFASEFFRGGRENYSTNYGSAILEHNSGIFDISFLIAPRVNEFTTSVERLPEFSFGITKYNLFSNLYYSNQTAVSNLRINWFSDNRFRIDNYQTTRFDSKHFLHYYSNVGAVKILPRAGVRFINYDKSSVSTLDVEQFSELFVADDPFLSIGYNVNSYDGEGEAINRVVYELGLEANATLEASWKSSFLEANSFSHSVTPYINWNYVPKINTSRDNVLFFDKVDRITNNNFIRFGLNQDFKISYQGKQQTFFSFNQYVDYHIEDDLGDKNFFADYGIVGSLYINDKINLQAEWLLNPDNFSIKAFLGSLNYDNSKGFSLNTTYLRRKNYLSQERYSGGSFLVNAVDSELYSRRFQGLHSILLEAKLRFTKNYNMSYSLHYDLEEDNLIRTSITGWYSNDCLTYSVQFVDTVYDRRILFGIKLKHLERSFFQDIF